MTPQEPEDEPAGDELPENPSGAAPGGAADDAAIEDALWRSIIENYGERPVMEDDADVEETAPPPSHRDLGDPPPTTEDVPETRVAEEPEEHYVPPAPPPLPTPPPARLLAWIGLFGVPLFVLVALVADLAVPSWLGLILMAWFVGGFVFLIASMRPGSDDDYDDGARL